MRKFPFISTSEFYHKQMLDFVNYEGLLNYGVFSVSINIFMLNFLPAFPFLLDGIKWFEWAGGGHFHFPRSN